MNYRHQYHAGNFADVVKHALLVPLFRGLQRKEKGLLHLDTHAGRGSYDLAAAARGDTLARRPEWPDGIGRLQGRRAPAGWLEDYVRLVEDFDAARRTAGETEGGLRHYPGSPALALALARPQDRLAFCERHPEEAAALAGEFEWCRRVSVHPMDGYAAVRAMLPPPEKRALVLIDPPYEDGDEHARVLTALGEGLRRLPGGTFAVWYPLTERARADAFLREFEALAPPPAWTVELTVAGPGSSLKMKGCGLLVVNPPWQLDREIEPVLPFLAEALAQEPGGAAGLRWIVPE